MDQQRLLFDYSPAFLLLCLGAAFGYAWLLYTAKHTWSITLNRVLFACRFVLVFLIALLLVGPILKLTQNTVEKPAIVILSDNSVSVKESVDSLRRAAVVSELTEFGNNLNSQDYDISYRDLSGEETKPGVYTMPSSDLAGALRSITDRYEGKNLAGIVLVSDGIYNSGSSPLYTPLRVPVFAIGVGDTTSRLDLALRNPEFNKIAYQGNKFPLRAEVLAEGLTGYNIKVSVFQGGKLVSSQIKNSGTKSLVDFDFQLDAADKGLQRIDVITETAPGEKNTRNNRATAFVEVVEGKKKILLIAPGPHPDIKALRAVAEKNSNYEFIVHIPGVEEADASMLMPGKADLIIFHQVQDTEGKTAALYAKLSKGPSSVFLIAGTNSNLRSFPAAQIPVAFERAGQWDEGTPVINPTFRDFNFSENVNLMFSKFPPAAVPFGKFSFPADASILLYQRIGSVQTDRPMLLTLDTDGHKTGIMVGEGLWRWRLNEYSESEKTEAFDEVFGKLLQYLSTQDDKRRFRVFPIQHEFTDAEPVQFESQVYNDLFEQVYGNTVAIDITDEKNQVTHYNYVTSPGGTRYRIGGLKEGVYRFTGSALLGGRKEEIKGEFLVRAQNIESQNLTADFGLLRKLAAATGGSFHTESAIASVKQDIAKSSSKGLIHSEDTFNPLINLRWFFALLLVLVSAEWFVRKYEGAY